MRRIIFILGLLFVVSFPYISHGANQGSVTVGPRGVSVDLNKTPPAQVIIDRRPVVVERPVIVERPVVVEKTIVQQAPEKNSGSCSMSSAATSLPGIGAIGALMFLLLGGRILHKAKVNID